MVNFNGHNFAVLRYVRKLYRVHSKQRKSTCVLETVHFQVTTLEYQFKEALTRYYYTSQPTKYTNLLMSIISLKILCGIVWMQHMFTIIHYHCMITRAHNIAS